jgi:hypothetical protein
MNRVGGESFISFLLLFLKTGGVYRLSFIDAPFWFIGESSPLADRRPSLTYLSRPSTSYINLPHREMYK